jgi:hypothetical protein
VTRRYLGESNMKVRMAFVSGVLAALAGWALAWGLARMLRWSRRR